MSAAALVLALAVVVSPGPARHRVAGLTTSPRRRVRVPVGVVAGVGCAALAVWLPWTAVAAAGALTATISVRGRRRRAAAERARDAQTLQGALDVLVGELRVGAHPVAALGTAARESRGRIGNALHAVAGRAMLGADVAAGLRVEGARSASPGHWERLAVCWDLAHTHGLAIATLVQAAHRDIAERERFRGRVEAGMAGARATAAILAGLPVLGVFLGHAIGAEPVTFLVSEPAGGLLLLVGVALICAGLLWSDRITSGVLR
ncbi:type II secretion system F family protein [Mycobacterium sp. SMC-4]|uniref:type II secretion system F family protein n=1 Tax=Mycobacterium sp. SMC-4 TaxID=2857059 RepID=UPI003CFEF31A